MIRSLLIAFCLAAAPISAMAQVTSQRIVEADGTSSLVHEVVVAAPRSEVWAAISTADGWRSWAAPVMWADPVDAEVIEGSYDPAASPGQPQTIRQRILVRIPGRLIAWRTIKAPTGFPDFETFSRVRSIFELGEAGPGQTRVRLTMVGYADTESGRRLLDFFDGGNSISLDRLRRRFVEGPLDWRQELSRQSRPSR